MSAFEAKTRFGELLHRVEQGEEIVITRHDRPVARVVREGTPNLESVKRSVEGLRQLQQRIHKRSRGKPALSQAGVRDAIGHGRRRDLHRTGDTQTIACPLRRTTRG
ncbi:MAG TPA: type II toxin-antitoxin system prevent-host-death family antitoxin [Thermoanaerobaculia bacterium]|nr:type II toxin-antitoxin system prevent-host-death family antitoxin [Thermoanaerobaculia bacterium]